MRSRARADFLVLSHDGVDIATGAAAAGGFLGAAWAAWRKFGIGKKPEDNNMAVLAARVAETERRLSQMDERLNDVFDILGGVHTTLSTAQADIREALTRLQERRRK
jgi:hypothetical protein